MLLILSPLFSYNNREIRKAKEISLLSRESGRYCLSYLFNDGKYILNNHRLLYSLK